MSPVRCLCSWLVLLAFLPRLVAADGDGSKVYKKVIPSVVWIHSANSRGSGTLIDATKRLILTNYHVVEENSRARVFFPDFRNDRPIAEKNHYSDRADRLAIPGRVIALEKSVDLALIQLDRIPDGTPAVPVAVRAPEPGQSVHSIGNTGKSDALWGYVPGKVRQVYKHQWSASLGSNRLLRCRGEVVETDSATNPGDSGGPLLNDAGELVGVTHGGATNAQLLSTFISVTEVQKFLKSEGVKNTPSTAVKPLPKREKALPVVDGGKFFKAETVEKLKNQVADLYTKHGLDLLIETYATVPADDIEKVRSMTATERSAYLRTWATKRGRAEGVSGAVVLICNDPKSFYMALSPDARTRFPEEFQKTVVQKLTEGLKAEKPDSAILEMAKSFAESVKSN